MLVERESTLSASITTAMVLDHLRLDASQDDGYLQTLLSGAIEMVEEDTGRTLASTVWCVSYDQPADRLPLPRSPYLSLTSVEYYDTDDQLQTISNDNFYVIKNDDVAYIQRKSGFRWPGFSERDYALKITFQTGYAPSIPKRLIQAVYLLCGTWYENRTSVSDVRKVPVPHAYDMLIASERVGWVA